MFEVNLYTTAEATRITLEGELDTLASQQLDDWFETHAPQFTDDIEVDLSRLTSLDPKCLHAFVRLDAMLQAEGLQFRLTGVTGRLYHAFRACALDDRFTFQYAAGRSSSA